MIYCVFTGLQPVFSWVRTRDQLLWLRCWWIPIVVMFIAQHLHCDRVGDNCDHTAPVDHSITTSRRRRRRRFCCSTFPPTLSAISRSRHSWTLQLPRNQVFDLCSVMNRCFTWLEYLIKSQCVFDANCLVITSPSNVYCIQLIYLFIYLFVYLFINQSIHIKYSLQNSIV